MSDLWSVSESLPRALSDAQRAELDSNPDYSRAGGKCPVCRGTGQYKFKGEVRECPTDEFGTHPMLQLFKHYCLANIPLEYQVLNWCDYPFAEHQDRIERYIENFETARMSGFGWEIMGKKLGVGKTMTAAHIAKKLALRGYSVWFAQFMEVKSLYELENRVERDWKKSKLLNSEFLVLDDIIEPRSDRMRAFFEDQLEEIIRHRTSRNLPTATTTNMNEADLRRQFPRIHSLLSAKQFRVELSGDDYRVERGLENEEMVLSGEVRPLTW